MLVERRVLFEKHSLASKAIDQFCRINTVGFPFTAELDSNKLVIFTYPSDKEVIVHLAVILKNLYLHRNVIHEVETFLKHSDCKPSSASFTPSRVESFLDNYTLFTYHAVLGGTTVLNAMLQDTLIGFLTIEALKLEKFLLDYGR